MKKILLFITLLLFQSFFMDAQSTLTLGSGTSSSATRGPFQRSDDGSSSVHSRANIVYTSAELLTDLTSSATISQINFDLGSTNIITASGDATLQIYMKNSSATEAVTVGTDWTDVVNGATLVGSYTFNTTNNFPGAEGFMSFVLDTPFGYTGGALELAVEWDCSNLTPADAGQPNLLFSNNGSLNWHWDNTTHVSLNYRAGSSGPPSALSSSSNRKSQRVNTQIVYTTGTLSTDAFEKASFRMFPNPANEYIQFSGDIDIDKVEVYNLIGKKVTSTSYLTNNRVDISSLSKGLYILRISSGDSSITKKIIKD